MAQQFTSDIAVLDAAIDNISVRQRKNDVSGCPSMTEYEAFLIANELDRDETDVKAMEYANCSPGECPSRKKKDSPGCAQAYSDVQWMARGQWETTRAQSLSSIESLRRIVEFMAKQEGTRMLLLASSGFLSGTLEVEQDMVIERALHANVVINALDSKGLYTTDPPQGVMGATARSFNQQQSLGTRPQESTNDAMNNLSNATGGLFFHNSNDLEWGFREVGMQPETSYLLAFAPPPPDSKYHRLKVTLAKGAHGNVQARLGYMSVAAPAGNALPERPIDHEVLANTELKGVPVQVLSQADKLENGQPVARLAFVWDVAKMPFRGDQGAHAQTVHLIWCLLDANGNFVTGKEGVVRFALTDATYQKVLQNGLTISGSLEAGPGSYRLRTVVSSDEGGGQISSFTQAMVLK
jgi:VWFA-related protein